MYLALRHEGHGSLNHLHEHEAATLTEEALWDERHHVLHGSANEEFHESDKATRGCPIAKIRCEPSSPL